MAGRRMYGSGRWGRLFPGENSSAAGPRAQMMHCLQALSCYAEFGQKQLRVAVIGSHCSFLANLT
eukprot:4486627-Amphidinium_carterae.1